MRKRYSSSSYTDIEIDLFQYKDDFLCALTDNQLRDELKRRKEEKDTVTKERHSYYVDHEIDISDYSETILDYSGDDELIQELENRGMCVYDKSITNHFTGDLKDLAKFVGLRWWATKEQIINEINFHIGK